MMSHDLEDIAIRDYTIRLGQFLKLAGAVESGAMAKDIIEEGFIVVNGEVCAQRGRQLHVGDVVVVSAELTVDGQPAYYRVAHEQSVEN